MRVEPRQVDVVSSCSVAEQAFLIMITACENIVAVKRKTEIQ
jgi:hypothetical protein